jgi:hypothetical protein
MSGLAAACVNAASSGSASGTPVEAGAGPAAAADTSAVAPVASAAGSPRDDDLDVGAVQKLLHCAPDATSGPCKVLAAMGACTAWNAVSPSGEGRYIGRGWVVQGTSTEEHVTILRARTLTASETANGQLPVKISLGEVPTDAGPAYAQAGRAVNAYERHDVPPARNSTVAYLKEKTDWPSDSRAMRTTGKMVKTFSDRAAFLCQGVGQDVLLVQPAHAGPAGTTADGLYADLWPSTW